MMCPSDSNLEPNPESVTGEMNKSACNGTKAGRVLHFHFFSHGTRVTSKLKTKSNREKMH